MDVASARGPGKRFGRASRGTRSRLRNTSRNQPPSGWGASPSARARCSASGFTGRARSAARALGERCRGPLGLFVAGVLVVVVIVALVFVLVVALELVVVVFLVGLVGVGGLQRVDGHVRG